MPNRRESDHLEEIQLRVTVCIDRANEELLERLDNSAGAASPVDVVRNEVASNLESVGYVRRVCTEVE